MSSDPAHHMQSQDISDFESISSELFDMGSIASESNAHATISSPGPQDPEGDSSSFKQSSKFYFQEDMVVVRVRYYWF